LFYLNRVILAGKIASGPEVRYTQRGRTVVFFTLKMPSPPGLREIGGRELEVEVMALGEAGERWAKGVKEGSNVFVEGGLFERKWEDEVGGHKEIGVIAQRISLITG